MRGASGMSPRAGQASTSWQTGSIPEGAALIGPVTVPKLYQRLPDVTPTREVWVCVRNNSLAGWNRFESPSLPDSENLTEQRQRSIN